ncbi:phage protein GemA/Gp16 family protein [Campylobacter gastrosuis]|uniref:Regulatory protein GemA n=1 Tax=Campylobacter gastrosuis TaxID=2974576 RepID=A0ABT7HQR6_9BACT|nr:phage protein GemA/Gp16 family protein [Campylobacter gastrosuis]MDL0089277.1 regulatory protein GemA [Campylobacter gastrosuis]
MTPKQEIFRKQLLTKIHTHHAYKTIKENDAWEQWLDVRFSVKSCKDLSIKELSLVLDILNKRADDGVDFKQDFAGRNLLKDDLITQKQIEKIKALANALGWDDLKLIKFINRQCRVILLYLSYISKLSKKQGTSVITGLNAVLKHKKG